MTEEWKSEPQEEGWSWTSWLGLAILALVGFVIIWTNIFGMASLDALVALATGWYRFLERTLPRMTWNWDLLGMGLICTALILGGVHWFLSWLHRQRSSAFGNGGDSSSWAWRHTWCGATIVGLAFFIGSAVVGTVHQIGWLASSPEPIVEAKSPGLYYASMRQIEGAFATAMLESGNQLAAARRRLWDAKEEILRGIPWLRESFHVLVVVGPDHRVRGLIVFPRDLEKRSRFGGLYEFSGDSKPVPAAEIPDLIARHQK
jgi:hypothetical protein